jgi:hypothetical protein
MNSNEQKSLRLLLRFINTKATVIKHRYAAQWLLETVIQVFKKLRSETHGDLVVAVDEWGDNTENANGIEMPLDILKQHVFETCVIAGELLSWWDRKELIKALEDKV